MRQAILHSVQESILGLEQLRTAEALTFIESVSEALASCFRNGGKVIIAGNGGSLCDAAHFAEELTGIFRQQRAALPAIALSDPGHLTCTANDLGFEWVFSRGIEAYGKPGDVFIGLTTSGNSPNIIRAMEAAKRLGLQTVALLGKDGGKLKSFADFELIIKGFSTSDRIQEAHMTAIHIVIEMIENRLFESASPKAFPSYAVS